MNKLGIVILNWNGHEDTIECIASIRSNEKEPYNIFLLDNGSEINSIRYIEEWLSKGYKLSYDIMDENEFNNCSDFSTSTLYFIKNNHNLGFAKGNNLVWKKINNIFDYTLILNNDTIIKKNSITAMVRYMDENLDTGAISCNIRTFLKPEQLWCAGGYFAWYGDRKYFKQKKIDRLIKNGIKAIRTPYVTGCVLMVRREIAKTYGFFTERFFFGEEDFNYCKRLTVNGIIIKTVLESTIYHKMGKSRNKISKRINSFILYFINRIIDLKIFYSPMKWNIWRLFYLNAVLFRMIIITKNIKIAIKVIRYVNKYTHSMDRITYETYNEIINIPEKC